jgi:hypothetical protein
MTVGFVTIELRRDQGHAPREAALHAPESGEAGLVERPEQWTWSSFRAYCYGETGPVRVKFQEWAPEIKRRAVQSFAEVESPLIRKVRE